jgi:hypothetical protein
MGMAVKILLAHLRERQEQCGVRAFQFHHVLRNNALEAATYPTSAQAVHDADDPEDQIESKAVKPRKMEKEANAITPTKQLIPIPPIGEKGSNAGPSAFVPAQLPHPVPPPVWSQMPGPNSWQPHFMSGTIPNSMPAYQQFPLIYDPQLMPQYAGQPGWPHPLVLPAGQPLQYSEQLVNGFHAPPRVVAPEMPVAAPLHPPDQAVDPHPIPSGDPPFAFMYPPIPFEQSPIDQSVRIPTKMQSPKTPKKTPGKRKRKELEDTPSQKPTRASNRTRTPRKLFEIDQ